MAGLWLLGASLVLIAFNLRAAVSSVGPVLRDIIATRRVVGRRGERAHDAALALFRTGRPGGDGTCRGASGRSGRCSRGWPR